MSDFETRLKDVSHTAWLIHGGVAIIVFLLAVLAGLCSHRENRLTSKRLGLPCTSRQYPVEYRLYPRELIQMNGR
jgi:hypothetical protein